MIEKLVIDFFGKVEKDEGIESINGKATFLTKTLIEGRYKQFNIISTQKATRLYQKYVEDNENVSASITNNNDAFLRDVMSEYLGYENFKGFQEKHQPRPLIPLNSSEEKRENTTMESYNPKNKTLTTSTNPKVKGNENDENTFSPTDDKSVNKPKMIIIIGLVLLLISLIYFKDKLFTSNNCIIWNGTQYEKSPCYLINTIDNSKLQINIIFFKKVQLNKDTPFFIEGKPNIWYGSNSNGVREFFNSDGIHPETKKPLKEITRDILASEGFSE